MTVAIARRAPCHLRDKRDPAQCAARAAAAFDALKVLAAGKAVHGADWEGPLARDLGVDLRIVRAWMSGRRRVPASVIHRLPEILRQAASDRPAATQTLVHMANQLSAELRG